MVKLNKHIKASTLIETMIAMVLILLCMGVSSMVYVSVINADNGSQKLRANLILDEIASKTKTNHTYIDEQIKAGDLLIDKTVEIYPGGQNLSLLCIKANDANKKLIAEHREIVVSE